MMRTEALIVAVFITMQLAIDGKRSCVFVAMRF
jgi:hypothetical protein